MDKIGCNETSGDLTGDGCSEIIGTWDTGVWSLDVVSSKWNNISEEFTLGDITSGDFNCDGQSDVALVNSSGLWYQIAPGGSWVKLGGKAPFRISAGDLSGDKCSELVGTWGNGVWSYNFKSSKWSLMTRNSTLGDITSADFDGDGRDDVASVWNNGIFIQNGVTLKWKKASISKANELAALDHVGDARYELISSKK